MTKERLFEPRLGRMRARGARHPTFVAQALRAAAKAGYIGRTRVRAVGGRALGRAAALSTRLRSPARRVVVKARVVRHAGRRFRAAPLAAHLAYLQRDGVDRSGAPGEMFGRDGPVDARAFAARCEDDRHHFRFMISPEDAEQMSDLRAFARELMSTAERDLGTRLDWIAADHWNTAHPHLHVLVRGRTPEGADLLIDRDYIARGLRARAESLVSLELGPRTPREIAAGLDREVAAERWTGLDQILGALAEEGRLDLRHGASGVERDQRLLLLARAATLERLGLATAEGPAVWRLDDGFETRLRELAVRGDIIATLHRAVGAERATEALDLYAEAGDVPIVGRLLDRGLHDEQSGRAYVVVDGVDGRAHHLRLADLGATGDVPVGGIVEARRDGEGVVRLIPRSDLDLPAQIAADGATWLDRRLLARGPSELAWTGFGAEARRALDQRRERLLERGLATRTARGVTFADGLLATLRTRELKAAGARIAEQTGLAFQDGEAAGTSVSGRYVRRLVLASGRFVMLTDEAGFRLLPWARVLDRRLGRELSGVVEAGGVRWSLGRDRGPAR